MKKFLLGVAVGIAVLKLVRTRAIGAYIESYKQKLAARMADKFVNDIIAYAKLHEHEHEKAN